MTIANFNMTDLHATDEAITGAHNVLANPKLAITHKDNAALFKANKYAFIAASIAAEIPGGWNKLASMTPEKVDAKVQTYLTASNDYTSEQAENKNYRSGIRRPVIAMAWAAAQALQGDDDAIRLMAAKLPLVALRKMGTAVESADEENPIDATTLGAIGLEAQDKANERAANAKAKPETISKGAIKEALETVQVLLGTVAGSRGAGVTMDGASEKAFDDAMSKVEELQRKLEG